MFLANKLVTDVSRDILQIKTQSRLYCLLTHDKNWHDTGDIFFKDLKAIKAFLGERELL